MEMQEIIICKHYIAKMDPYFSSAFSTYMATFMNWEKRGAKKKKKKKKVSALQYDTFA